MADTKLANLTASGALTGTELFYADNGSQDVKVTASQLSAFIIGAGAVSVASGKTLTVSNTLTLAGTDSSTLNIGSGGTLGTAAFVNTGTSGSTVPLLNAANTFGATQTLTPAANTNALAVTGYSLTGANAQAMLDLAGTLNTSGNPAAIKLNLTNTASGANSKFADFQLGGTSKVNFVTGGTTPSTILNIAGGNFGGWLIVNDSDASTITNKSFVQGYFSSNTFFLDAQANGGASVPTLQIQTHGASPIVLASGTVAALTLNGTTQAATFSNSISAASTATILSGTAVPAGGTAGAGYMFSSTANFGTFFGSGAPTLSAAKGSLYLRSDGSATNNRAYINTDGSTTWTALTTAA
jgi:hypothetical protein